VNPPFDPGPGGEWEMGPEDFWPDDQAPMDPLPEWPPDWGAELEGGEDQLDDDQADVDVDPWDPAVFPWRCAWGDIQRARFHPDSLLN